MSENVHMREERGQVPERDGTEEQEEENKYSGVVRKTSPIKQPQRKGEQPEFILGEVAGDGIATLINNIGDTLVKKELYKSMTVHWKNKGSFDQLGRLCK